MTREYEMALLTAENHGPAHEFLRAGRLGQAMDELSLELCIHHIKLDRMDKQRIILEVLSKWQSNFDQ